MPSIVRVTARVPCSALVRACSATAADERGVLRHVVNRRGHFFDRDRRLDRLRRLILGAGRELVGDVDRRSASAALTWRDARSAPGRMIRRSSADHEVERVGDRAGHVGRDLGLHRQVAFRHAAHFFEQLHDGGLHAGRARPSTAPALTVLSSIAFSERATRPSSVSRTASGTRLVRSPMATASHTVASASSLGRDRPVDEEADRQGHEQQRGQERDADAAIGEVHRGVERDGAALDLRRELRQPRVRPDARPRRGRRRRSAAPIAALRGARAVRASSSDVAGRISRPIEFTVQNPRPEAMPSASATNPTVRINRVLIFNVLRMMCPL